MNDPQFTPMSNTIGAEVDWKRWPRYHFFPHGNYLACNLYWALGLKCPHHDDEAEGRALDTAKETSKS